MNSSRHVCSSLSQFLLGWCRCYCDSKSRLSVIHLVTCDRSFLCSFTSKLVDRGSTVTNCNQNTLWAHRSNQQSQVRCEPGVADGTRLELAAFGNKHSQAVVNCCLGPQCCFFYSRARRGRQLVVGDTWWRIFQLVAPIRP